MPYRDATDAEKDAQQQAIAHALPPGWQNTPAGTHGRTIQHVDGYGVYLVWETSW